MKRTVFTVLLASLLVLILCASVFAAELPAKAGISNVETFQGATYKAYKAGEEVAQADGTYEDLQHNAMSNFYPEADNIEVTLPTPSAGAFYLTLTTDKEISAPPTQSDEIYFIDQQTSTTNVKFKVYPSKLEPGKTYYVYMISNDGTLAQLTKVAQFSYFAPFVKGDVDGKPGISANDALYVLQAVAHVRTLEPSAMLAADVDGKPGVSANDALYILQAVAHLRTLE